MTKNFRYFLASFLLSFFFFLGINYFQKNLEDFFFWQETKNLVLSARIEKSFERFRPFRNWKVKGINLQAKAVLSVFIDDKGEEKVLFEKNSQQRLPIASLTKLMTALVALENYELSRPVKIAKILPEDNGQLKIGEKFEVKDLLYFLLISSNNTAAHALSEIMGSQSFVFLMNKKAQQIGMKETFFFNPTGLDPDDPGKLSNFSTAKDLLILLKTVSKNQLISEILLTPEIEIYSREKLILHKLENTNELLKKRFEILAGKTGWTPQAKGCLAVVVKAPRNKGKIIFIILGSEKRFEEMEKLIDWTKKAYVF